MTYSVLMGTLNPTHSLIYVCLYAFGWTAAESTARAIIIANFIHANDVVRRPQFASPENAQSL